LSIMLDEIHEQPAALNRFIESQHSTAALIAGELRRRKCRFGMIAARGTSDNAATYGKYIFEIINGMPMALAAPSIFTLYNADLNLSDTLAIGISQSGQAADVNICLQSARSHDAITVGITNEPNSNIARAAEFTIYCSAGAEKSVAATKTYTTSLAALLILAAEMTENDRLIEQLKDVPSHITAIFNECESRVKEIAYRHKDLTDCIVLARGTNRATAFEAALKLAETCYVKAEPYSSSDFLHGPIAVVDKGTRCLLFAPEGPSFNSMYEIAEKLVQRGAALIIVSDSEKILALAAEPIRIPVFLDDVISPIVYIVVGQLFANYLAQAKGLDPDCPRGLSKITITR